MSKVEAAWSQDLTTADKLAAYLTRGDEGRAQQWQAADLKGRLEELIHAASAHIAGLLGRPPLAPTADRTYVVDGDGSDRLLLFRHGLWPIVALTSLTDLTTGQVIPARPTVLGEGWVMSDSDRRAGMVRLVGYRLPVCAEAVEVVGRFGFDRTTALGTGAWAEYHRQHLHVLEEACLMLAATWYRHPDPTVRTVTIAGETLTSESTERGLPTRVAELLAPLRSVALW